MTKDQLPAPAANCTSTSIIDPVEDPCAVLDANWRLMYLNPAASRLFGQEIDQFSGREILGEFSALFGDTLEIECRQAMAAQQVRELDLQHRTAGTWFELRLFPSKEKLTIQWHDITARKRVELARIDREKWYSTLVNTVGGNRMGG